MPSVSYARSSSTLPGVCSSVHSALDLAPPCRPFLLSLSLCLSSRHPAGSSGRRPVRIVIVILSVLCITTVTTLSSTPTRPSVPVLCFSQCAVACSIIASERSFVRSGALMRGALGPPPTPAAAPRTSSYFLRVPASAAKFRPRPIHPFFAWPSIAPTSPPSPASLSCMDYSHLIIGSPSISLSLVTPSSSHNPQTINSALRNSCTYTISHKRSPLAPSTPTAVHIARSSRLALVLFLQPEANNQVSYIPQAKVFSFLRIHPRVSFASSHRSQSEYYSIDVGRFQWLGSCSTC